MESSLRILVVDDDPELLSGTCRLMEQAGYETIQAGTGGKALAALRASQPRLILLDRQLPDLDGLEVCRLIKADPATATVLVIMISGVNVRNDEQVAALATGADDCIVRPIRNQDLRVRIDAFARIARLNLQLAEEIAQRRLLEAELEDRVRRHTEDLEAANQQLRREAAERQQAELALRTSAEFSRSLIQAMQDGFAVMDTQGVVVEVNPALAGT